MWLTIISTYDSAAPNTAMLSSTAPCPVSDSRKPITPGTTSASVGALRPLVTDRARGRYPARDSAKVCRE